MPSTKLTLLFATSVSFATVNAKGTAREFLATYVGDDVVEELVNCKSDDDCDMNDEGIKERCATLSMPGYTSDLCVAEMLCEETINIDGSPMSYFC